MMCFVSGNAQPLTILSGSLAGLKFPKEFMVICGKTELKIDISKVSSKMRLRKVEGNFSENSSDLVAPPFPKQRTCISFFENLCKSRTNQAGNVQIAMQYYCIVKKSNDQKRASTTAFCWEQTEVPMLFDQHFSNCYITLLHFDIHLLFT